MSAPNFYIKNAKRYFVVDEQDSFELIDCFFDDKKDDLKEVALSIEGFEPRNHESILDEVEKAMNDNHRDYYAVPLGACFSTSYTDKFGHEWAAYMYPCLRSGYWSGAVLDYYIQLFNDDNECIDNEDVKRTESLADFINDFANWQDQIGGDEYKQDDKVAIGVWLTRLVMQCEDKFYEFAEASGLDEYVKVWQASNGEAAYTNLSEIKRQSKQ